MSLKTEVNGVSQRDGRTAEPLHEESETMAKKPSTDGTNPGKKSPAKKTEPAAAKGNGAKQKKGATPADAPAKEPSAKKPTTPAKKAAPPVAIAPVALAPVNTPVPISESSASSSRAEFSDGVHPDEFGSLVHCTTYDPHRLLGCHAGKWHGKDGLVVRAWHPDAVRVELIQDGKREGKQLERLHLNGLFGIFIAGAEFPYHYKLRFHFTNGDSWTAADPYHFLPAIGDLDLWLHSEGNYLHAYQKFGAQLITINGVEGVAFCVWAPNARRVSVIGDFNRWTAA